MAIPSDKTSLDSDPVLVALQSGAPGRATRRTVLGARLMALRRLLLLVVVAGTDPALSRCAIPAQHCSSGHMSKTEEKGTFPLPPHLKSFLALSLPLFPPTVARMAMADLFTDEEIKKMLRAFAATNSFDYKKFFEMLGLKNKSLQELNMFFSILDTDKNGYLEPDEIQLMLQDFSPNSRHLTDKETQEFMGAGDKDEDGKIGIDEFIILVNQS
ncbi:parvalbumin alpha [Python bivittatus]|uniref:Parvalbumin n=1 Tax=Python bivittatus TaxID=176946 RepID=A0A9F2N5H4_PYTBI|nr:parvalbumin alpha [Python bivittatus]